jgi:thioredoxin-dependent peroxiredoxin
MKTLFPGATAPDFLLPDQEGKDQELSQLLVRGPVVLFFLPAAGSVRFSREVGHFRDLAMRFAQAGTHRVGISVDDLTTTELFAESEQLDFPLLADFTGAVADAYGVRRRFWAGAKPATFVIAQSQRIVEVIQSQTSTSVHGDRALEVLARLA